MTLVVDESVSVGVAVLVDPIERRANVALQFVEEIERARPGRMQAKQRQKERRAVNTAVVRRLGYLAKVCQLVEAQLMQNLARLLVAPVVRSGALMRRQHAEGVGAYRWLEGSV